jgi:oxygen-independent coproporphyrinogen-3 oxidase
MNYHIEFPHTGAISDAKQMANMEAALKILDHNAVLSSDSNKLGNYDLRLIVSFPDELTVKVLAPDLPEGGNHWEYTDIEILDPRYNREQRLKELIRLGIITVAGNFLHLNPPWGILRGVRPTKIFHYYRNQGLTPSEITAKLLEIYGLAESKAKLVTEVGVKQEKFFKTGRYAGIYIGIPFCPSRCKYCSFSAVPLGTHGHLVKSFVHALLEEIEATGALVREHGFTVDTIYMGGGTPTAIDDQSFSAILKSLIQNFHGRNMYTRSFHEFEFTVEAGRPETITPEKLQIMAGAGVTRVSVNPQTMNPFVMERIGRNHTIAQVYTAVEAVKKYPQFSLNMDLILGLPGENGMGFMKSLAEIIDLEPHNITIHALAPKRASEWRKEFDRLKLAEENDLRQAADEAFVRLRIMNYHPYYLYRQRFILADLENIGFAKLRFENNYNIQMMEERQTIFGLGAGAITKWVIGPDYRVFRYQNPKCPATYSQKITESIVKKAQQTRLLLG